MTAPAGMTVWLTGLPGAGKTTLAVALRSRMAAEARQALIVDGDDLRRGLSGDLDLSRSGRRENVRRAAEVALVIARQGAIVLVSLISPYRADRDAARRLHEREGVPFAEVWVATDGEECARHDRKGLYTRAATGELTGLSGWDAPYEQPRRPDAVVRPLLSDDGVETVARLVARLLPVA